MEFPCIYQQYEGNLCTGSKISDVFYGSKPTCGIKQRKECMKSIAKKSKVQVTV